MFVYFTQYIHLFRLGNVVNVERPASTLEAQSCLQVFCLTLPQACTSRGPGRMVHASHKGLQEKQRAIHTQKRVTCKYCLT